MKKTAVWLLLCTLLLAGCGAGGPGTATAVPKASETASAAGGVPEGAEPPLRLGLLAGPTGMGAARLLQEAEELKTAVAYQHTLFNAPDEVTAKLISGELDVAAVPTNLAAVLYQKTKGGVRLLALNTLGVLHLLSMPGESIGSIEDLKGKTVYSSGQGAVPEYVLNYILSSYGLADEVRVVYEAEHDAVIAALAAGKAGIAVLPEPKVTAALSQIEGLSRDLDLTRVWEEAVSKNGSEKCLLSMGCVVGRTEFVEQHGELVDDFLKEYEASIAFMKDPAHADEAAKLCESFGIIPKAAVALKALPGCNLSFVAGKAMQEQIAPFYDILFGYDPASVGGALPDDAFYYVR